MFEHKKIILLFQTSWIPLLQILLYQSYNKTLFYILFTVYNITINCPLRVSFINNLLYHSNIMIVYYNQCARSVSFLSVPPPLPTPLPLPRLRSPAAPLHERVPPNNTENKAPHCHPHPSSPFILRPPPTPCILSIPPPPLPIVHAPPSSSFWRPWWIINIDLSVAEQSAMMRQKEC